MVSSIDLDTLTKNASQAASLLKAMSNENRLLVLCTLCEGEQCVSDLNEQIPLSQSALSQHLARLREDGLVSVRREAQTIYYRIASDEALAIIMVLHKLYCHKAD